MLVELTWPVAVAANVVAWIVLSVAIGWVAARVPAERLRTGSWLLRLTPAEVGGMWERTVHVSAWKDHLPEAGTWFGGVSKRALGGTSSAALDAFATETRRAELTHWLLIASTGVFVLWNPLWLAYSMLAFALVANAPCIIVQRHNRGRIERIARRRGQRA